MPPRTTTWAIEPHTRAKHVVLGRYLDAWLPMMAVYNGRIVIIDGFAGPGRYQGGEDGSPIIAMKALLNHPHFKSPKPDWKVIFFFIEEDARRAQNLQGEIERLRTTTPFPKWMIWGVERGEFAPVMAKFLDSLDRDGSRLAPTFAFVDPFGFSGAPLQVVARIASYPGCECLITFAFESINRFLEHPNAKIAAHYDELFGTPDWRLTAQLHDSEKRRNGIVNLYREQLVNVAGFEHVRTFEMINDGNRTEYFLYFGTHNKHGLSRMKEAMWKADPVSGQSFSDRTVTDQVVLFEPRPDLMPLRLALQSKFRGRSVSIEDVEDFVLVETPYCERRHLKRATLAPMEREKSLEVKRPPGRGRRGTYPPGTFVRFA